MPAMAFDRQKSRKVEMIRKHGGSLRRQLARERNALLPASLRRISLGLLALFLLEFTGENRFAGGFLSLLRSYPFRLSGFFGNCRLTLRFEAAAIGQFPLAQCFLAGN